MFIGHFGVGFAAKRVAPTLSLGTAFLAAQFIDLIWPTLLLAGVEKVRIEPGHTRMVPLVFEHYPVSHSLLAVLGWALLFGVAYWLMKRQARAAMVLGALVVSHWLLDAIVHVPDLPLAPGSATLVGLGLWNSMPATIAVEAAFFAAGLWLYVRATRPADRTGRFALAGLVAFLVVVEIANFAGPPPPDVAALAWVGHAQWLLVAWGYWVDAHRLAASDFSSAATGLAPAPRG
jgi:hypothetical protein